MTTETSSPARWFFGLAAAFAVFALVGVYSSRMAYHTSGYDQDEAKERYAKLAKLQAADEKTLTSADWVDQDKGTVRIPIDEAMTEEVDTLKAKPLQMGAAIPGVAAGPGAANTIPAPATAGQASTNASPTAATPPPPSATK
jgi:hypothetical protein